MKKILSFLLTLSLVLGLFSGCGRKIDNSAYEATGDAILMEGEEPEDIVVEEEAQELTLAYYPDRKLNPLFGSDYTNRILMSLMYQPLFAVDNNKNVTPILAGKYQVSANSRNVTVWLDEKATFSDGSYVTPNDVIATYQQAKVNDYYMHRFTHLLDIVLTEDGTGVVFQLDTAYSNFMLLMDVPIVKAHEVEAAIPLGTGPYVFTESASGATLQRNPNWWCGNARIPATDIAINLVEVSSPADVRDAFQFGGENSVSVVCTNPMSGSFAEYRCDYELWEIESGYFMYIVCNILYSEHFDDGTLRTFLTYAIDRETLAQDAYNGMVTPVTLPCSPEESYYNKTLASKYGYDALKFIERLGRYSIPQKDHEDKVMRLLVNSEDSARVQIARSIAAHLTELGLPCTTLECTGQVYKDAVYVQNFDIYLGLTRLSANMDLSEYFKPYGKMSRGGLQHEAIYGMCLNALQDVGNYYNLYQKLTEDGRMIPVMFGNYNVYAHRGLLPDLNPARDNVFYYALEGKTMETAKVETVYTEE